MESDAEVLKVRYGSMNTSVARGEQIQLTSTSGQATTPFLQPAATRSSTARIREILKNVLSIIAEAGFEDAVPKGLIFAGGVTHTRYFYETLHKLHFEYREGSLRRDVYDDRVAPELAAQYSSVIALASRATEPGVTFEARPLESILQETERVEPTPSPSTRLEAELDYTFEDHDEPSPREVEPTPLRPSKTSRSSSRLWFGEVFNKISNLFDADEED